MKLFLDSSVLLAASGSNIGASRALFTYAASRKWTLISSVYAIDEVMKNLGKLPLKAAEDWPPLRRKLQIVDDIFVLDRPSLFPEGKDRPILFTALASAEILLTLDKTHFAEFIDGAFYGMRILTPYGFLQLERDAGRLQKR